MEWVGFIRRGAWANAGFGCLRAIWEHLLLTEPRYDPTVFPLQDASNDAGVDEQHDHPSETPPSPHASHPDSAARYRYLYLSGELTPLDIVRAILPLIRRDTSPPGEHATAWVEVHADSVLRAAEASTLRYKEKRSLGPLDGIPAGVKDDYDMDGYKTTLGSPIDYADPRSLGLGLTDEDGTGDKTSWCVRKLEEAGAIILGKLSMHEFGMDTPGYNITYGTPRNPHNPSYYPGGSSSGSAYAIATGLTPIALGGDGGGSIRIPASFCSVYGLKPTHGRLSFHPGQSHSNTASVNGPMAADMRSLISMYNVVCQPDPLSSFPRSRPVSLTNDNHESRPKVLGIPGAWFDRATPIVQKLCWNLIDRLVEQKGYTVVRIDIPFVQEGQVAHALTLLTDGATLVRDTARISPANRILLALGRTTPATDYLLAQKLRRVLMQHLAWLWQQHPDMIIVTPTTACAGWPIRDELELKYGISDGDQTLESMEYVWLANFCGVPSISVPAGFAQPIKSNRGRESGGEVPVGLMGTGEWCSEEALLRFGLDAEEVGLDIQRHPPNWTDIVAAAKEL